MIFFVEMKSIIGVFGLRKPRIENVKLGRVDKTFIKVLLVVILHSKFLDETSAFVTLAIQTNRARFVVVAVFKHQIWSVKPDLSITDARYFDRDSYTTSHTIILSTSVIHAAELELANHRTRLSLSSAHYSKGMVSRRRVRDLH